MPNKDIYDLAPAHLSRLISRKGTPSHVSPNTYSQSAPHTDLLSQCPAHAFPFCSDVSSTPNWYFFQGPPNASVSLEFSMFLKIKLFLYTSVIAFVLLL